MSQLYFKLPYSLRNTLQNWVAPSTQRQLLRLLAPTVYENNQALRVNDHPWGYKSFDQHQCIFIHIPKTGGISVATSLFGSMGGGHASIWWYQLVFTPQEFKQYFKFAFVRNPWDRLFSAFHFLKNGGMNARNRDWANKHLSPYPDFESFVMNWLTEKSIYSGIHFQPQFEFLCIKNQQVAVDFVGRFETLALDYEFLKTRFGYAGSLPKLNEGNGRNYRDYYNTAMIERVGQVYAKDLALFGYNFGNEDLKPLGFTNLVL